MNKVNNSKRNKRSNNKKIKQSRKRSNKTTRRKKITGGMNMQIILIFASLLFIHCFMVGELNNLNRNKTHAENDNHLNKDETMESIKYGTHKEVHDWFSTQNVLSIPYLKSGLRKEDDEPNLDSHFQKLSVSHPEYKTDPNNKIKSELSEVLKGFTHVDKHIQQFLTKNIHSVQKHVNDANKELKQFVTTLFTFVETSKQDDKKKPIDKFIDQELEKARKQDITDKEKRQLLIHAFNYAHAVVPLVPLLRIPLPPSVHNVIYVFTKIVPPTISQKTLFYDAKTAIYNSNYDPSVTLVATSVIDLIQSKIEADSLLYSMEYTRLWLQYLLDGYIDTALPYVAHATITGFDILRSFIGI